jgi:hypothetical protein
VLISRIIEQRCQGCQQSKIEGEFIVYRGISLPDKILSQWKNQNTIRLEGYSSSSKNEKIARYFASDAETD